MGVLGGCGRMGCRDCMCERVCVYILYVYVNVCVCVSIYVCVCVFGMMSYPQRRRCKQLV